MSIGFVALGMLSGMTAALYALGAGAGLPGALLTYAGTGALTLLASVLPGGWSESPALD